MKWARLSVCGQMAICAGACLLLLAPLSASAQPDFIKWHQPPTWTTPQNFYYGWNETSLYGGIQIAADDWLCDSNHPVTGIRWWGSYRGWNGPAPAFRGVEAFYITIWTDVPVGVGEDFSHPGEVIWEYYAEIFTEERYGWDVDPIDNSLETCFYYTVDLDLPFWFYQEPLDNIYWLSIAAIQPECPCDPDMNCDGSVDLGDIDPFVLAMTDRATYEAMYPACDWYKGDLDCDGDIDFRDQDIFVNVLTLGYCPDAPNDWGWKTRPRDPYSPAPDAAVRILDPTAPMLFSMYTIGEPITWPDPYPATQWDLAFELADPNTCDCNGDYDGDGDVDEDDVDKFVECLGGRSIWADLNCDGQVNMYDQPIMDCQYNAGWPDPNCCPRVGEPKWSQPPEPYENPVISGHDELSNYARGQLVADDWFCDTPYQVGKFTWWGSFEGWGQSVPPDSWDRPTGFMFTVWRDAGGQPGEVIWESCTRTFDWTSEVMFSAWDYDLCDPPRPPEACFRFDHELINGWEWFAQAPGDNTYWFTVSAFYCQATPDINHDGILSIMDYTQFLNCLNKCAIRECAAADLDCDGDIDNGDLLLFMDYYNAGVIPDPPPEPTILWGWTTRLDEVGGLVMGPAYDVWDPTAPEPADFFIDGAPIGCPNDPLYYQDMAFQLNWDYPCGDANCDGLINNGDIDPFLLALDNYAMYQAQYPGCDNADMDFNGLVNNGDIDPFVYALMNGQCPPP